ncbi:MAG: hypothetical protein ACK5DG_13350 [Chitinophagaceae bacterium]|jgi:hypothetical protein
MKTLLTIITQLDQPEFICNLVERLAYTHPDLGYGSYKRTGNWQPVETSTNDIYAGGTVQMIMNDEHFNIPYIANFLFTCLKGKDGVYKLEWGCSLS